MTTSRRLDTVRGFWGAGESGNWDGAAQFIGRGYYFIDRATGVESRTAEELLEGRADEEAWSNTRFEIGEVYDTPGDAMIVEAVKSGTITGSWRSMSADQRRPARCLALIPTSGSNSCSLAAESLSRCQDRRMTTRIAHCACGRVTITVEGEPLRVVACHCDFCQKRSGSIFQVSAQFAEEQVLAISGETKTYNGLEIDGVGTARSGLGINNHFCATCGSTIYWDVTPTEGQRVIAIAVGNFVDPDFPAPTAEYYTTLRHRWVPPIPTADQFGTVATP